MGARAISYFVARCDGCNTPYTSPNTEDCTEYKAERTAISGGWKRDRGGSDVCCPACATLHSWERPNGQRMQRGGKVGTGL